jgi:hypothetical protein
VPEPRWRIKRIETEDRELKTGKGTASAVPLGRNKQEGFGPEGTEDVASTQKLIFSNA